MTLKINIHAIPYVLENNIHVEFFVWSYLRQNNSNGIHLLSEIPSKNFCISTIKNTANKNIFYEYKSDKFYLKSIKNFSSFFGNNYYECNFKEISRFARKISESSGKIIKKWNSTLIKYFLISVYASRYEDRKPYALSLISKDLGVSITTIQRALKVFDVQRKIKTQKKYSPRSYYFNNKLVNLSPNYYYMPLGKIVKLNH
jgi:hypothetical protein